MNNSSMLITLATLSPVFVNFMGGLYLLRMSSTKHLNRKMLALFMFNSCLLFTGHFLFFQEYIAWYQHYDFVFIFALLSFYPTYYLYTRQVFFTGKEHRFHLLHFSPAIIASTALFTLSIIASTDDFSAYFFKMNRANEVSSQISQRLYFTYQLACIIHTGQIIIYSFLIVRRLRLNSMRLKNYFSNSSDVKSTSFICINLLFLLFMISTGLFTTFVGRSFFFNSTTVIISFGLAFSLMHMIVCLHELKQAPVDIQIPKDTFVEKVALSGETMQKIEQDLLLCFEKQRPWLNPDLKIWDLAMQIGTNKTYLSKVLNQRLKTNFNDFVNKYRYQEVCRIMKDDDAKKASFHCIWERAGFGSEASFTRTVKKMSGLKPSELREKANLL